MQQALKSTTIYLTAKADKMVRQKCLDWDVPRKQIWSALVELLKDLEKEDLFGKEVEQ